MPDDADAKLDDLWQMLGPDAGNLAMALEQLTDAMALVNLHAVYCRVEKGQASGIASAPRVPLDIADILSTLAKAKSLVQETLQRLRISEGPAA